MTTLTLQQVLQAYGQKVAGQESVKQRDPVERELLLQSGDTQVQRENPARTKPAGARPRP